MPTIPLVIAYGLLPFVSYLLGAIPFGYLLVRLRKGIDIRTVGSGNLGATNVARALGTPWFAVCFILDFLKGFVPAFVIGGIAVARLDAPEEVRVLYGFLAVAGHMWPVYLRFRGGKGVATGAGLVVGIAPAAAGIAALVFLAVFLPTRYVSLGSILASISLPVAYFALSRRADFTLAALGAMALLVVVRHRGNIRRILAGTESRAVRTRPAGGGGDA